MTYHNASQTMPGTGRLNRIGAHEARGHIGGRKTVAGRRRIDDGRLHRLRLDRIRNASRRTMLAGSESFNTTSAPGIRASKASLVTPG